MTPLERKRYRALREQLGRAVLELWYLGFGTWKISKLVGCTRAQVNHLIKRAKERSNEKD